MNILLIQKYNPFFELGASPNRFRGLIRGLSQQGHDVTIAVTGGLNTKDELKPHWGCDENVKVVYLSQSNHYGYFWGRLNTYIIDDSIKKWIVRLRLRRLLNKTFDIVWLTRDGNVLELFCKEYHNIIGRTLIELNEFNDIYKESKGGNYLQKRKAKKQNDYFLKAIKRIDLFAVMTETLVEYYREIAKPEAQFLHLPMTVDLSRFDDVKHESNKYCQPYIAFTGTMNNQKDGVDILIKAFAMIAKKYPKLHLYLAGFWHYDVPSQEALIKDFGLTDRIHHIGVLDRDSIPPFVSNATLLALSRPDTHQAQGGFPTKLGEYLATGNPVCVTRVGEIPNYLYDNESAFLATPGDVNSFADAMDSALCDETNAKRVGCNGRKVAEDNFNAAVQSKRLADFLQKNIQ